MNEFLKLYQDKYYKRGWTLEIYHSSIMDWCISIGYKTTNNQNGNTVIEVQSGDMDLAFAKAQIELKEWLLNNEGGY